MTFRTCRSSESISGLTLMEGFTDRVSRCDSDILRQFSLNISRQKRNKNGSLIFIRRDAIFCRPQKFRSNEHLIVRRVLGIRSEPTRTQRCVYHVKGMNDCLRRIAGLNSPASPPLKKIDTSHNNHVLQKNSTETDKMQARLKRHTD